MPAFVETAGRSWRQTTLQCAVFSVGDAMVMLVIYGIAVVAARRITKMKRTKFYLFVSALGAVAAVFIELVGKAMRAWSYSERMPVFVGLGILPILQLATLGPTAVWVVSTWRKRHQIHDETQN